MRTKKGCPIFKINRSDGRRINGAVYERTPEEYNGFAILHEDKKEKRGYGVLLHITKEYYKHKYKSPRLLKVGENDFHGSPKCLIIYFTIK
ncbi:hypothetical protein [Bacillus atrophaeus]|uniref:hypothetical protein n=1 Tax=Bacillus atrophaeus TaxID=1452 RepID=UPI002E231EA5|nr:hypothetical protein [Bacillus atrophaeus]MED4827230.1 hypothetical protein [Bacillus atrophaeus]MED4854969.1 hypothetical protein [Bacillus atrophaeus]